MLLTRDQAWEKRGEWTRTDALRKHVRAVEDAMRAAACRARVASDLGGARTAGRA